MTPDLLIDIASRHAVHLEGLKSGYVGAFERFLRSMQSDILGQIREIDDPSALTTRRLNRVLRAVRDTLKEGYGNYEAVWRRQLAELAEYEADFTTKALGQVIRADFTLPSPAQLYSAAFTRPLSVSGIDGGSLLGSFFNDWSDKTRQRIEGAVRLAAAQGRTTQDLVRTIRGTRTARYGDGIVQMARRDVSLMARTSLQHVAAQARAATYRANSDIVKAEQFVAVLDGRTSTICRGLSGQEFEVGEGPMPPIHIACRSLRVAVLRDGLDLLDKGGTQISRGQSGIRRVDADQTYYDWIKTQPQAFQDDVLGSTRGKLLRDGGLSASRFQELQLDKEFRPRSLDEIRALEPVAFERAGI